MPISKFTGRKVLIQRYSIIVKIEGIASVSRSKNTMLNTLAGIVLQLVTAICGLIVPRLVIGKYGSDINGLVASITQFLSYISLLEGGLGGVFRSSLYKPLADRDMHTVSGIINEQKSFYKKLAYFFIIYVGLLCVIYPKVANTGVEQKNVVILILILSVSTFLDYYIALPYSSLISADQQLRVLNFITTVHLIINLFITAILVAADAGIITLKICTCAISVLKPLIISLYVKKNYRIDPKAKADANAFSQRWNGLVHHFAYYIHNNTDIAILTLTAGVSAVSVYALYAAVINGIQAIINAFINGAAASVGNLISSESSETINKSIDKFEFIVNALTTFFLTITALMVIPFMRIYAASFKDVDYIQPGFAYIFIAAQGVCCLRSIYITISLTANKYRETQFGAILECLFNLGISILLATLGETLEEKLIGVAIGTLIGMVVRYVAEIVYLSKNVVCRSCWKAIKLLSTDILIATSAITVCKCLISYDVTNILDWIIKATLTSCVTGATALLVYYVLYKDKIVALFNGLRNKTERPL